MRHRIAALLVTLAALAAIVGGTLVTTQSAAPVKHEATCAWIWTLHGWIYYCWYPGGGGGGSW